MKEAPLKKPMRKGLCSDEASTSTLDQRQRHRTLEEMIMKLEMEEEKRKDSVVMCARDALNQYPRFSLDGKDAMYRSSFRDQPPRRSLCHQTKPAPVAVVAGVRVVWCKPGVVARLMGLDAMPMPVPQPPTGKPRPVRF